MPEGKRDDPFLRPATESDAELLLEWRNDPQTREASFQQEPIGLEEHRAWLAGRLGDPDCALQVIEVDGRPAGSVRLDREGDEEAEIHIVIAPESRGGGLSIRALDLASEQAGELLGVRRVRARVKSGNEASLRAFRSAGFEPARESDDVVELVRPSGSRG
jgi:RimJ/RimL family protein N-acetyltransferase